MNRFIAISLFFYIALSSSTVSSELMLCIDRKNITIIPQIDLYQRWKQNHFLSKVLLMSFMNIGIQLGYLVKALLETSYHEVWFYSPIRNRCIRQTEENYDHFLETKWRALTGTDDNDILNLLLDFPHTNDQMVRTLLFFSYYRSSLV